MRFFCSLFLLMVLCVPRLLGQGITYPSSADSSRRTLQSIIVEGNKKTQTSVILREMGLHTGDTLPSQELAALLQRDYTRLYNLNIFTSIALDLQVIDTLHYALRVTLREQWYILPQADVQLADRNINVWWQEHGGDLSRINLGLYVVHKNLTGRLDKLSLSSHVGYTQQLSASYSRPYIDRQQKQGVALALGYSRSRELAYATYSNKLLFARHNDDFLYQYFFAQTAWIYRAAYHTRHIVSVGYHQYHVGDTVLQLNNEFFAKGSKQLSYLELAYRYEYNGVDNWNYPRKGLKVVASLASRWGLAGMGYQAVTGVELGAFRQLHHRWYGSLVLRGKATMAQQQQPYFLAAAFGYKTNYVRGYEYYVVEANNFAIARLSLKYEAVRKRYEKLPFRYLPQLPLWVYPKLFVDAGYAANKNLGINNNNLANKLLYSVGMGIDIITAYDLKLRIEFAYNHLGENGLYLHANSE